MRATMLVVLLAACGGSDSGGFFDADVTIDGAPSTFSEACKLTESDAYLDISAANGAGVAFEIKWKKDLITMAGSYPTGGIVGDIAMFVRDGQELLTASGEVTFTSYGAPEEVSGTFELTATGISATGSFDCRD